MTSRVARYWWYTVMAVSAAAAAVLSFTAWRDLALYTGGSPETAWWLPIAVDIAAAGALTAYVLWSDQFAHAIAVVIVAVSATGNAFSHRYRVEASGIDTIADGWMVTAVWTLPPLVLYVNSQLYARKLRKDADADPDGAELVEPAGGDTGDTAPPRRTAAVGGVAQRPRRRTAAKTPRAKDRISADRSASAGREVLARRILDNHWTDLTWDELAKRLPAGRVQAGHARKLAREMATAGTNGNATLVD